MEYPSKLVEVAVEEIAKLPGIGKKTALRLVLHLLKEDVEYAEGLSSAISELRKGIKYCETCHAISDDVICSICASKLRDKSVVCVVEETKDMLAIENTNQFRGTYHILGGVISPLDGIGPGDLKIDSLINRINSEEIKELILAINPTMEGDTTAFYISKKIKDLPVKMSTIARGIPVGGELEYADEVTLGRSILTRIDYQITD